jgi:peptidoglycan/xylan/chitin deacetylase (PgdA/CDA1 family)
MDRRSFLEAVGGAALGGAGFLTGRKLPAGRPIGERQNIELTDAAGAEQSERIGTQHVLWSVDTHEPLVAMTFDDGPFPDYTERVLRLLDEYKIKATFNVMGYNAERHADLVHEEVARGCEIGNHTWTHRDLAFRTLRGTELQISRGREIIESIAGVKTRYLRPPRGELTGFAARYAATLGYDILLWSITRGVPHVGTPKEVSAYVLGNLRRGDIFAMHDGIGRETFHPHTANAEELRKRRRVELDALPAIIEGALAQGLRFATVSELVASATSSGRR